jgi:hypothetical protein
LNQIVVIAHFLFDSLPLSAMTIRVLQ